LKDHLARALIKLTTPHKVDPLKVRVIAEMIASAECGQQRVRAFTMDGTAGISGGAISGLGSG
jgi:hypothetical protein